MKWMLVLALDGSYSNMSLYVSTIFEVIGTLGRNRDFRRKEVTGYLLSKIKEVTLLGHID
jgi:hypothetical protein